MFKLIVYSSSQNMMQQLYACKCGCIFQSINYHRYKDRRDYKCRTWLYSPWQFYYLLSHTTHFPSHPLIDKTPFALQQHYLHRLSMVLTVKDRSTAENRIENSREPMNQIIVSLGFTVLREGKLLYTSRECIVMQLCNCKNKVFSHIE